MTLFGRLRETLQSSNVVQLREFLHEAIERVKVFVGHEQHGKRKRYYLEGGEITLNSNNLYAADHCDEQIIKTHSRAGKRHLATMSAPDRELMRGASGEDIDELVSSMSHGRDRSHTRTHMRDPE